MMDIKNKKKKVSKKNKKSWRKHVDIKDVNEFLDNVRSDERLGQSFSKRPDSQLFVIDKNDKNAEKNNGCLSKLERRRALKNKEVKCFDLLKAHTLVPDPIVKRNSVRKPEERKNPITQRIENERREKGLLKFKEKIAIQDRLRAGLNKSMKPKRGVFAMDIWQDNVATLPLNTHWMTSDSIRHSLTHLGLKKKRVPQSIRKKTSALPSVEIPHPGSSYNPSYTDHQDLLSQVAEREMKLIKEEAHINRVTTQMFKKVTLKEREKNMINELSEGLSVKDEENVVDNPSGDNVVKSINPPVKNAKKTSQQRRKQRQQKELNHRKIQAKVEKKKVSDIYKLKQLKEQLNTKEKRQSVFKNKKLLKLQTKLVEPKTLSKVKFELPDLDFKLAQELTGSLRNSEPGDNLLKDRYKSLQQRNIIAPGTKTTKSTKAKMKKYQKVDHKID